MEEAVVEIELFLDSTELTLIAKTTCFSNGYATYDKAEGSDEERVTLEQHYGNDSDIVCNR